MSRKQWIDFSKVRDALDFENVLDHYGIAVPKRGKPDQVQVHCPFHDDSTPSCSVNTEKHIFRCFGCNAKGNVLEFVVLMEGGDPDVKEDMYNGAKYAVEHVLGESVSAYGRDRPGSSDRVRAKQKPEAKRPKDDEPKAKPKGKPPKAEDSEDEPPADQTENPVLDLKLTLDSEHDWLAARGITKATAERYELGYCKSGIMAKRIAIPIHNLSGELVAYVGRWADEDVPDGTLRYKFPKGFLKGLELFNIHRAALLNQRHLTLVEGYWSAIRWHDAEIPVAALMGTACTDAQAALVRAVGFRYVTLLMDGDDAGRQAGEQNASILAKHVYVRIVELPEGEKPDSVPDDFLEPYRL